MIPTYTAEQVADLLQRGTRRPGGLIARGSGRSYGDAAQNGGGTVLDMTHLRGCLELDSSTGTLRAGAGRAFVELLRFLAAHRRTLPVVPGTRHLTVGGAIASDVHGKNHPVAGSLARHVHSLLLCTPARGPVLTSAELEPELFHATLGGMGLTGVVIEATLTTVPLDSALVSADVDRTRTFEDALALMAEPGQSTHTIAWLDLLARGPAFGRGVVTRARPLEPNEIGQAHSRARGHGRAQAAGPFPLRPPLSVPERFPGGLLRPSTVRAFNAARWRAAPGHVRQRPVSVAAHLFPLDTLGAWNRLYGAGGLVQYQFAVPDGAEGVLIAVAEHLRALQMPIYLAVLKRLGAGSPGPLSFPLAGWTLAVDLPARVPGLAGALQGADELVIAAGGRVYLAKDSRLAPHALAAMYPRLEHFRELRARLDPQMQLRSDMARRLGLCP